MTTRTPGLTTTDTRLPYTSHFRTTLRQPELAATAKRSKDWGMCPRAKWGWSASAPTAGTGQFRCCSGPDGAPGRALNTQQFFARNGFLSSDGQRSGTSWRALKSVYLRKRGELKRNHLFL